MFLKVQHGLQTFGGAVTDGVALCWGAKRPGTLALMSVILPEMHRVALYLRLIQPLQSLHTACSVRLLSTKPRQLRK